MNEPNSTSNKEPRFTWSVSLSFWFTQLFATTIYASVTLAPKMMVWLRIRGDYVANQIQLVRLEEQVHYLARVADALENDPDFASEMARAEFNAYEPGAERIPVDDSLSLSSRTAPATIARPTVVLPWYASIVERMATRQSLRMVLLGLSAVLVIFAFTFLHEECEPQLRSGTKAALRFKSRVVNRYVNHRDAGDFAPK
jgi:hypothetical protein